VRGRTQKAVDREDLAVLVGRLHSKAVEVVDGSDKLVPVSKAAEKARVQAITVIHLILGGFLERAVRLAGHEGQFAVLYFVGAQLLMPSSYHAGFTS